VKQLIASPTRSGSLAWTTRMGAVDTNVGCTVMGVEFQRQEANTSTGQRACRQRNMAERTRQER